MHFYYIIESRHIVCCKEINSSQIKLIPDTQIGICENKLVYCYQWKTIITYKAQENNSSYLG